MSVDPSWIVAFKRFGLGPRPGDVERAGDPREALLAEIASPEALKLDGSDLLSTTAILQAVYADEEVKRMQRQRLAEAAKVAMGMPAPSVAALEVPAATAATNPSALNCSTPPIPVVVNGSMGQQANAAPSMAPTPLPAAGSMGCEANAPGKQPDPETQAFRADAIARIDRACSASIGFGERLVAFWSNHFCVSTAKSNQVRATAGALEREAIRPHVLGRFYDMLVAVEQHPAMLHFLDNAQSIGPDSKAGKNRKAGLNENLAREILELHTMGVGSGYTQADVTQLARIITGWTVVGREGRLGEPGTFVFNVNAHEPGAPTVLGRAYDQDGVLQGETALADIAAEPATAEHIAKKLVRHFIADNPDPEQVKRLARVFVDTKGDLAQVSKALVTDPASWAAPETKFRNPWEFIVASFRAFARSPNDPGPAINALNLLGMPLWRPAGPNGFSDDSAAWLSPEGMKTRVEIAAQFAHQIKDAPNPVSLIDVILGPKTSIDTRQTITRAETPEQAYALLLLSPEFQRR